MLATSILVSPKGESFGIVSKRFWYDFNQVALHFIERGKAHAERVHRKLQREFRDEGLNQKLVRGPATRLEGIESWRVDYNTVRPAQLVGVPNARSRETKTACLNGAARELKQ